MTHAKLRTFQSRWWGPVAAGLVWAALSTSVLAEYRGTERISIPDEKSFSGILALDGEFVHNVGELQLNITNWGLLGSRPSSNAPYSDAPSAMWPAGSGVDYLWAAGLWVGALKNGTPLVSTGQFTPEFLANPDEPIDTVYRMQQGEPGGARYPDPSENDDGDFDVNDLDGDGDREEELIDEDPRNEVDDDGDGLIDEDFAAIGNQHFRCVLRDDTALASELFPEHEPLDLSVIQQTFQWENEAVDDFVGFEFEVKNVGVTDLSNVFLGFFADCDIGSRSGSGIAEDDLPWFWQGKVTAADGSLVPISVAAMYDADGDNGQAPGYFGIMFLDHPIDAIAGEEAPFEVGITTFQAFAGQAPFEKGGDPTNDAERYQLLSRKEFDTPPPEGEEGKANDFRIMLGSGPFKTLSPEESLLFRSTMVVGAGSAGLRRHAAEAALTFYGAYFDKDGDKSTGTKGREVLACEGESLDPNTGEDLIFQRTQDCADSADIAEGRAVPITEDDLIVFTGDEMFTCGANQRGIWVNGDCSFEELRFGGGVECKDESPAVDPADLVHCTGVGGKETRVTWLVGLAPEAPHMRLWQTAGRVHIFWDNISQLVPDVRLQEIDFESYLLWRADNWDRPFGSSVENGPESKLWGLIAEYDVVSYFEERIPGKETRRLPLGPNTGLDDIRYIPAVLDPEKEEYTKFAELSELVDQIVAENTFLTPSIDPAAFMRYRDESGGISEFGERYPELAKWQCCYDQVDSLYWDKLGVEWFEYVDKTVHDGIYYFYAVTASDYTADPSSGRLVPTGRGLVGDPQSNFAFAVPKSKAQSAKEREDKGHDIFVLPNPATRESLAEFSQLNPNEDDPTGVRVMWKHLPRSRNTISIYTLAGDLVETIQHDGRNGDGSAFWNLVSRNGQEVVSGIYLYSVESDDSAFDRVIGRFVVVR